MSKTLIYRTNKEFDKCAELLQNISSIQKSRRDAKSSTIHETNRKKQNSKIPVTKSSFIKTNINNNIEINERRSSYSPNKTLHSTTGVTTEKPSLSKKRLSPNKSRKHVTHFPSSIQTRLTSPSRNSSLINNKSRRKSPLSSLYNCNKNDDELIRSSSCGDLPSSISNYIHKEQTYFITHLKHIRTISKQIRTRNSNTINDHLWNELENSLSSALSYANNNIQFQLSLIPLQNQIIELRKQLQTTNIHLYKYDLTHHNNEQYIDLQKKFNTNQIQCTQLLLYNKELKIKCHLLQNKLDHLKQNNIRLIQRLTQQDLHSIIKHTELISTNNHFLLRKEILFLKDKLYYVYDDLTTLFNRNNTLQCSIEEQKQQLLLYKQRINDLKESAQQILRDLDNRSIEEKIKRFLNNILIDQHHYELSTSSFHQTHITPTKSAPSAVKSSSFFFETPQKPEAAPAQPVTSRSRPSPFVATSKLRPKSLFITPTVLNDSKVLSKFQDNRNPTIDITHCSSSTIEDADSTLTSSSSSSTALYYQQEKRPTLYNNLPSLTVPKTIDIKKIIATDNRQIHNNESRSELDQISDLTSKMFSSGDEVDVLISDINTSTSSSSTIPSDAEKLMHM